MAEVDNIGGGRANSTSILEALQSVSEISGKPMKYDYLDQARAGDHICYISDLSKMKRHLGKASFEYLLYQAYSACRRRIRAEGPVAHEFAFDL